MKNLMAQKQVMADFKKAGAVKSSPENSERAPPTQVKSNDEILLPDEESFAGKGNRKTSQDNTANIKTASVMGDNFSSSVANPQSENKHLTAQRTSIINQGEIFNQRNLEKEAIRAATFDAKQSIPTQIWYDSLRETDDGRFSAIEL
mmetsp:Transcript_23578/g.36270  ORF Transcript_23578/g.36270 Transcript_23578/m.36270 type:complete len:147 (+) Transcript_23578:810-1250(+)|eukprot:CAMPEP_0170501304 /NCGR_PEP_ID=MMETSP0208-20121228/37831_1 /TAXON_ID=197538 /ORGANISM="Strombidium inclinatum, Strain S3" /LENGTH=146 /DNA_ID=CAMNT_0010779763 /DNA_START=805 /DNA_END=1245 /DNA_ORIENTATION=-